MSVRNRTDLFSQFRNSYHCGEEREVPFQAKDGGTKKLSASGYHAIPLAILSASASGDGDNFFGLWISSIVKSWGAISACALVRKLEEGLLIESWPKVEFAFDNQNGPKHASISIGKSHHQGPSSGQFESEAPRIKELFQEAQKQICHLGYNRTRFDGRALGGQSRQLLQNGQRGMAAKLDVAGDHFRELQGAYLKQIDWNREFVQTRISKVPMPSTKSLLVDSFLPRDSFSKEAEGSSINEDRQLQDTVLMGNQITDLEIMKEREEAIHRICKSCLDVLEILQHMKSVTERQDEKLDLIDTNMETAQSYIAKSTQRIQKVQEGQRSALWRNVVILALVSMILLLTIKIMFR